MSRHQNDPLRPLTADERQELTRLSRSLSAPAAQVERSRALLAIADGASYTAGAPPRGGEAPGFTPPEPLPRGPRRESRAVPSALGHCGWGKLYGGRPPGRTT